MARINPAVKTVALLALGLTLSFNHLIAVNLVVIALCALGLIGAPVARKKLAGIVCSALLAALSLLFTALWFGRGGTPSESGNFAMQAAAGGSAANGLLLATRVLAFAGIGVVFVFTTGHDELVASYIRQLHLPPKYAYGALAAFHCAGSIRQEYARVRLAFQVRGLKTGLFSFKPLFVMLVNALHWSGDFAAAMESKGFDADAPRSSYLSPTVKARDYCFCAAVAFLCVGSIVCNII